MIFPLQIFLEARDNQEEGENIFGQVRSHDDTSNWLKLTPQEGYERPANLFCSQGPATIMNGCEVLLPCPQIKIILLHGALQVADQAIYFAEKSANFFFEIFSGSNFGPRVTEFSKSFALRDDTANAVSDFVSSDNVHQLIFLLRMEVNLAQISEPKYVCRMCLPPMYRFYSLHTRCRQHFFGEQRGQSHGGSIGGLVSTANLHRPKMLRYGRTAGLVRLPRSKGVFDERRLWAGCVIGLRSVSSNRNIACICGPTHMSTDRFAQAGDLP